MTGDGISINDAMNKWHITEKQAKKLDKLDGQKNDIISGSIYTIAKEYYENLEADGKQYGKAEGKTLVNFVKNYLKAMSTMPKSTAPTGTFEESTEESPYGEKEIELFKSELNAYLNQYKEALGVKSEGKDISNEAREVLKKLKEDILFMYEIDEVKEWCPDLYELIKED